MRIIWKDDDPDARPTFSDVPVTNTIDEPAINAQVWVLWWGDYYEGTITHIADSLQCLKRATSSTYQSTQKKQKIQNSNKENENPKKKASTKQVSNKENENPKKKASTKQDSNKKNENPKKKASTKQAQKSLEMRQSQQVQLLNLQASKSTEPLEAVACGNAQPERENLHSNAKEMQDLKDTVRVLTQGLNEVKDKVRVLTQGSNEVKEQKDTERAELDEVKEQLSAALSELKTIKDMVSSTHTRSSTPNISSLVTPPTTGEDFLFGMETTLSPCDRTMLQIGSPQHTHIQSSSNPMDDLSRTSTHIHANYIQSPPTSSHRLSPGSTEVSNFTKEQVMRAKQRGGMKGVRYLLEEIFTKEELLTSSLSGTSLKQASYHKLDEARVLQITEFAETALGIPHKVSRTTIGQKLRELQAKM